MYTVSFFINFKSSVMKILSRCVGFMVLLQNRIPMAATALHMVQGNLKTGRTEFGGTVRSYLTHTVNNQANICAMKRGALIVFEGGDHSGKTTQCNKLIRALESAGEKVKFLKFPDRTSTIGQMIDNYLGNKCEIEDHSVHLLFSANRWEKQPIMMELLESGTTLIVDRYAFSGVAFTAAKPGFDMEWCRQPDIGLPRPDLVCFLTLDTEAAAKRGTFGGERYERTDFQKKVMNNFEKLKDSTWKELDADKSIEDLHREILHLAKTTMTSVAEKPIEKLWIPDDKDTKG